MVYKLEYQISIEFLRNNVALWFLNRRGKRECKMIIIIDPIERDW